MSKQLTLEELEGLERRQWTAASMDFERLRKLLADTLREDAVDGERTVSESLWCGLIVTALSSVRRERELRQEIELLAAAVDGFEAAPPMPLDGWLTAFQNVVNQSKNVVSFAAPSPVEEPTP